MLWTFWPYAAIPNPALGFLLHLIHHRQGTGAGADEELAALPGDCLFWRNRRVPERVAECFGWFLFALADLAAIDYYVMLVRGPVDAD